MSTSTTRSAQGVPAAFHVHDSVPLREPSLHELTRALRGAVALPGSEAYADLTAAFNTAVEVRPCAVAAVADAYDVVSAVRFAARTGLRVSVQSTGHGATAVGDDVLLVHTGELDECVVHPEGWARVGSGVRWRRVIDEAAAFGLVPLAGSSSGVGVVGYTTGGGLGLMSRAFGLASDRVRAIDVVTGKGRLVRATPSEHADLFWALRGGKGSLGIVTAIELDLVPLESVYAGALHFDGADAPAVAHAWPTWAATLPLAATTALAFQQLPDLPGVPRPLAGRPTVAVRFVHTGSAEEGARLLAPLRAVATPVLDRMGEIPCTALDSVFLDPVAPMPVVDTGLLLRDLPPDAVTALLRVIGPGSGSPLVTVDLRQLGGAVAGPARHDSAVCSRDAGFSVFAAGLAVPPVAEACRSRCEELVEALAPWSTGTTWPNFGRGGAALAYDGPTADRLRALVQVFDPKRVLVAADPLFARVG
jgi:hypothetical protein